MHLKIDAIAKKIGLTFFDPRKEAAEQTGLGAWRSSLSRHQGGPLPGGSSSGTCQQPEEERRVDVDKGSQQATGKTINLEEL